MVVTPYLTSENGKEYIKGKALALQYVADRMVVLHIMLIVTNWLLSFMQCTVESCSKQCWQF